MNRRKTVSLLLSLLIHAAVLAFAWWLLHHHKPPQTAAGARRTTLALKDFVIPAPAAPHAKSAPTPQPTPQTNRRPAVKPKPKPAVRPKPRPKKAVPKPKPKAKPKPKPKTKPRTHPKRPATKPSRSVKTPAPKRRAPRPTHPRTQSTPAPVPPPKPQPQTPTLPPVPAPTSPSPASALAGALGTPAMPQETRTGRRKAEIKSRMSDREFRALYKDEFDHYSKNQKRFIRNNLNRIQAITQYHLTRRGYPLFAAQQHMQGVNVVEFYLHPNGDISGLKIIGSSGFGVLDDNSLDTIRAAYKDYPLPKETTKIRFYIHYRIY